ncbi:MAG: Gfo/Idh/MocA family oxidoreductase [Spirochaetaceae bacterium]|jgi:predicted dehydrogenase|nr:Gfo/Idh/MocA family oxidoreductase [Spirochaetaceae bacterium]
MVKLAVLGAWHVHVTMFIDRLHQSGEGKAVLVWDDDEARGKECAGRYGIPFEGNLDTVLNRDDIDGVMVECATTKHTEIILRAAAAKKHVFSDKALALKTGDCLKIKESVEKNGVKFLISLESKITGPYRHAKKLVDDGKLGRISSAYFRRAHGAALQKNLPPYWFDPAQTGGGATLDLGCHGLYLLPQFCGTPKKVTALMNEIYGSGGDENSTTVIEFENGALGTAHTSFVCYRMDNLLEIIGTEGVVIVSGHNPENYRMLLQSRHIPGYGELTPVPRTDIWPDDEFPIVKFARLIQSGEKSIDRYNIDEAIALTRLIERAYESARTGKTTAY